MDGFPLLPVLLFLVAWTASSAVASLVVGRWLARIGDRGPGGGRD